MLAHADAVIGSSIRRVNLGGISQIEALEWCAVPRNLLRIVGAYDGLSSVDAVVVAGFYPGKVERGINLSKMREVQIQ